MNEIFILKGAKQSGKTTQLVNWVINNDDCSGILAPVIDGKRHLYSISTKQNKELEAKFTDVDTVSIGRFVFNESVFSWGREQLNNSLQSNKKYLVIDEIGPLEIQGKGLEPIASKILQTIWKQESISLILVVRESLVDEVISHFNLEGVRLINHIDELEN